MTASPAVRIGRGARRAVTENLGLKAFAAFASIWLFSLVHGAADEQRSIFVDLEVLRPQPESGKILVSELPERVKVTLRGSRSLLSSIEREDWPPVQIDLRDGDMRYYYFDPTAFDFPPGVTIEQLAPASIPLTWAELVERRLPVVPNIVGRPSSGLALREPVTVEPPQVAVRGPQGELDPLTRVTTEVIDISGLPAGRHESEALLSRLPQHASYLDEAPVRVVFEIVPEVTRRVIERVQVAAVGGTVHADVRPQHVDIEIEGPAAIVDAIDPDHVVPYVDAGGIVAGAGEVPVTVQVRGLPTEAAVIEVDPREVLVSIPRRGGAGVAPVPAPPP